MNEMASQFEFLRKSACSNNFSSIGKIIKSDIWILIGLVQFTIKDRDLIRIKPN